MLTLYDLSGAVKFQQLSCVERLRILIPGTIFTNRENLEKEKYPARTALTRRYIIAFDGNEDAGLLSVHCCFVCCSAWKGCV